MIYRIIVNAITLSRVILSMFSAYFIITGQSGILMNTVFFATICATDLIDGKIARKFSACSSAGAVFDVIADLFYLMTASIALIITGIYPAWMMAVIIGKFLEFWCTSAYIKKSNRFNKNVFTFDRLGRKVIGLIYILPFVSILLQYLLPAGWILPVMNVVCMPIAIGAVISSMQRVRACMRVKGTIYI